MGPIKRIDLSQIHSAKALADSLKGMGELRVSERTNTAGNKVTFLRERTLGETIKDFFGINAASRQQHATAAIELINGILKSHPASGKNSTDNAQGLANIRVVVLQRHQFTGNAVAAQVQNYIDAKIVKPLEGGLVAASRSKRINLMQVDPMRVVADNAMLRSTTVERALQKKPDSVEQLVRLRSGMNLVSMNRGNSKSQGDLKEQFVLNDPLWATPYINVIPDLQIDASEKNDFSIKPDQLKMIYAKELQGKSGTLVLEPFPDSIEHDGSAARLTYSDAGIKMMMEAIIDAVTAATKLGKQLSVTVACEDSNLFTRLNSRFGTQQDILLPENESDSNSGENVERKINTPVINRDFEPDGGTTLIDVSRNQDSEERPRQEI